MYSQVVDLLLYETQFMTGSKTNQTDTSCFSWNHCGYYPSPLALLLLCSHSQMYLSVEGRKTSVICFEYRKEKQKRKETDRRDGKAGKETAFPVLASSCQKTWSMEVLKYIIGMEQQRLHCLIQHALFRSSTLSCNPFIEHCFKLVEVPYTLFVEQVVRNLSEKKI